MNEMTSENYVENVTRTDCVYDTKLAVRLVESARLLHAAIGLVTESAELIDMLKKHIYYAKPLDLVNAKEEVGDVAWYIGLAIDEMKTTMNEVLTLNIEKLKLRYPNKFTSEDAINRDVVAERVLLEKPIHELSSTAKEYAHTKFVSPSVSHGLDSSWMNLESSSHVSKVLPLLTTTEYDPELRREYIVVDGVRFIEEKPSYVPEEIKAACKKVTPCIPPPAPPVHPDMCCGNISFSSLIYKSKRAKEWLEFAEEVANHIENYSVKQYGDAPNDQVNEWSIEHCLEESKKYSNRYGKNQREGQDVLGFLKSAHYQQIAATKHKDCFGKENSK